MKNKKNRKTLEIRVISIESLISQLIKCENAKKYEKNSMKYKNQTDEKKSWLLICIHILLSLKGYDYSQTIFNDHSVNWNTRIHSMNSSVQFSA